MAVLPLDDAFWWSFRNGLLHFYRDKAIKPFILYYKKRTCHLQGPLLPSSCAFPLHALPSGNAPLIECQGPLKAK